MTRKNETTGETIAKELVKQANRHLIGNDWRVSCNADMLEHHIAKEIDAAIAAEREACAALVESHEDHGIEPGHLETPGAKGIAAAIRARK